MGVLAELEYQTGAANPAQRVLQRFASTTAGAWTFARTAHPIDKLLYRRSGGRTTLAGILAGLPVVMLTTTGAKSGKSRTMPLIGFPIGGDLAVIGSNYGQQATPGWVYNLEADPNAQVDFHARSSQVVARRADDDETAEVFRLAAPIYGGYEKYVQRASHRTIRVFVLESTS